MKYKQIVKEIIPFLKKNMALYFSFGKLYNESLEMLYSYPIEFENKIVDTLKQENLIEIVDDNNMQYFIKSNIYLNI